MSLSPLAVPFFSCPSLSSVSKREEFLLKASASFSSFDFHLFSDIMSKWESCILLDHCFSFWRRFIPASNKLQINSLHILSFNVRGFEVRWNEVSLLCSSCKSDILILLETGDIDLSFAATMFNTFRLFYQKGENKNGGILIMVKVDIHSYRIKCLLPNVCAVEILGDEVLRIVGVYAPESKSWCWDDLCHLLSQKCVLFGDFNVDLIQDSTKATQLQDWADSNFLVSYLPESATSKRSDRIIDYAFAFGITLDIQVYNGKTTSDHRPILSVVPFKIVNRSIGRNTHWKVFSLFSEYTFSFWKRRWDLVNLDRTYHEYNQFLFLLSSRCSTFFHTDKYRPAIPVELRSFLSYIRALSFKQQRTKCPELRKQVILLKKLAKDQVKKFFSYQLSFLIRFRNSSNPDGNIFWSKSKKFIKPSSSSLNAFISPSGLVIKDPVEMCDLAADFYENFFQKSNIVKPHPYTDSPVMDFGNSHELIPEIEIDELIQVVQLKRKKKSLDAHGLSSFMFDFLDLSHWSPLLKLYNHSFQTAILPSAWKDTRMILLAKKESICLPSATRPISLIDSFLKIGEKLFLSRFRDVLSRRGLLPDQQSGFRQGFRLQTRLLLFLEEIQSLLSNSSPVCTLFIDYKSAFDRLWHEGCVGKLLRLGIPPGYMNWIAAWLRDRRCYIEINGSNSRWFSVGQGGPQGSVLTPSLFISYHCDLSIFLSGCSSHLFADDVAAVLAGNISTRYTEQCIELEKQTKKFIDRLELYSLISDQPLNYSKTEAMFSARAISFPKFEVKFSSGDGNSLNWVPDFKYLGYVISRKVGWGKFIKLTEAKVRKRISLIKSFKIFGCTSADLRKTLFYSYILPIFTWIYPIYPLLTWKQRNDLSHFYFTSLRRCLFCLEWNNDFLSFALDEPSLEDRCVAYWHRYFLFLADSVDGKLLLEQVHHSIYRSSWLNKDFSIMGLRKSKRFVPYQSIIERVSAWISSVPHNSSVPYFEINDLELLQHFPDSFC